MCFKALFFHTTKYINPFKCIFYYILDLYFFTRIDENIEGKADFFYWPLNIFMKINLLEKLVIFSIPSGKSMNETRMLFFKPRKWSAVTIFPRMMMYLYTVFHDSDLCCGEETHMHPFMEKYFLLKNEADVQHSCGKFIV